MIHWKRQLAAYRHDPPSKARAVGAPMKRDPTPWPTFSPIAES